MNKIYKPLDPGIKDAVMLLRDAGIQTSGSCDGKHHGAVQNLPYITVEIPNEPSLSSVRVNIVNILIQAGYRGFTIQDERLYQKNLEPWMFHMRVTFWSKAEPA